MFELWFRFTFLVLSFIAVIIYAHRLRIFSWPEWTIEQKWAIILLFGLMAYDNPVYPLEILVNGWFPIFLNRLLYATFIVLILLFWLTMFDGIRLDSNSRTFKWFYLPKLILLGLFWIVGITVFTWAALQSVNDPAYNASSELPGFLFFQVFELILVLVYLFWLVFVMCRACGDMKTLPFLGVRVKFFAGFTLLVIFTVLGGLIFGSIGFQFNNAAEFLSYMALFNLYCYTLAFVYLPAPTLYPASISTPHSKSTDDRIGMVRLEDDEDGSPRNSNEVFSESTDEIELDEVKRNQL